MSVPAQRTDEQAQAEIASDAQQSITADLLYVRNQWGDVLELRLRGTPRPWSQRRLSASEKAEADELAAVERRERSTHGIGEHPAPLHVPELADIIDAEVLMRDLRRQVRHWLSVKLCRLVAEYEQTPEALADALKPGINDLGDFLETSSLDFHWSAVWLTDALQFIPGASQRVHMADGARKMRAIVHGYLDENIKHALPAPCLACDQATLEAHLVDPPYVVCTNPECVPEQEVCGNWDSRGRPMWPEPELLWLNDSLDKRAADRAAADAPAVAS